MILTCLCQKNRTYIQSFTQCERWQRIVVKVRDLIEHLDFDELNKVKKDLEEGGIHLTKLIEDKIKEKEKQHDSYCSICMNNMPCGVL